MADRKTKSGSSGKPSGKAAPAKKKRASKPRAAKRRAPSWLDRAVRAVFWFFVRLGLRVGVVVALILAASVGYYYVSLPDSEELLDARSRGSVTLLDAKGDVFAWRGAQFGGEITPGDVSPHLVNAIIAAEDRRFYSHFGIDPRGLARAMVANVRAGRFVQGGSTLTQQVAKNVFLTSERTIERKLKEIPVAIALELKYAKDEILSIYMNRVYLGAGTTGFEAAAQRYFSKSAKFVNLPEAAMLAGLLKAPSRFAPTSDMGRAQGRAGVIINAMKETGFIDDAEAKRAIDEPAELSREAARRTGAHFADWVMEDGPAFLTGATAEDVRIRTTFDPAIQAKAEEALAHIFETRVRAGSPAEAAIVVMEHDGRVRAIVGGRDPRANTFNRATQALRQTGSAFKPVVYAAAMEAGYGPFDTIEDKPLTMDIPGSGRWSPKNYSGRFEGVVTLEEALAQSINTVAVRLSERVGRSRVRDLGAAMGLTSPIAEGPAVALGVSEATLLEMTSAYAVIANGGETAPAQGIQDITLRGDDQPVMTAGDGAATRRVMSQASAARLTGMMQAVIRDGTGTRADPGRPAAGKTGTTQGARDAWFIGFTGQYVIGVWMGKDDNAPLVGVTGGGLPAAIWREVAVRVHEGLPVKSLKTRSDGGRRDLVATRDGGGEAARGGGDDVASSILRNVVDFLSSREGDAPTPYPQGEERIDR